MLLAPQDDVAVALVALQPGEQLAVGGQRVTVADPVPPGHKLALRPLCAGATVRKYGYPIGHATAPIPEGGLVHTHNLEAGALGPALAADVPALQRQAELAAPSFSGYRREGRRAGTRNHVAVISTVNCSADVSLAIARLARSEMLRNYPHVDGVCPITHAGGCGMPAGGPTYEALKRCLEGVAAHPNVAGVLVVGLGCEVMRTDVISQACVAHKVPCRVIAIQESGGTAPAIRAGLDAASELLAAADTCRRTSLPLSELVVGTECGGSDAHSGITANPLLGRAGDLLMQHGVAWVLGESPETYGAEHLLIGRARTPDVADGLRAVMSWWERYTAAHGATIDNNPAPGNKDGGITTVYEKALGAVSKGGSAPLEAVLAYAQPVTSKGLSFMDTPGMDDVSVTGLIAGGCSVIAFTTGRGSCLAAGLTPIVKIASTTALYERMRGDMDFDAGVLLTGSDLAATARELADSIVAVASGRHTLGEAQGLGDHSFAPWDLGPTL